MPVFKKIILADSVLFSSGTSMPIMVDVSLGLADLAFNFLAQPGVVLSTLGPL